MAQKDRAAMQKAQSGSVNERVMVAGAHNSQIIGMLSDIAEKIGDFQPGLTVLFERETRAHQFPVRRFHKLERQVVSLKTVRQRLSIASLELGLGIKCVHVTRTALHEEENHA